MSQSENKMKGGSVINKNSDIILYVLKGYEGLPSVDPITAGLLLFVKLENLTNVQVKCCNYAVLSEQLPMLSIDGVDYTNKEVIMSYLELLSEKTLDSKYEIVNRGRIWAYKEMTKTNLEDSITLNSWVTEPNIIVATTYHSKGFKFPTNLIFARNLRKMMEKEVKRICKLGVDEDLKTNYARSKTCLQDLEVLLGKKPYFFGDTPSTLDIYVFALVSHVMIIDYPDSKLKSIILADAPNVAAAAQKFIVENGEGVSESLIDTENEYGSDRAPIALIAVAGFIAVSTMMMYAVVNGIIRLK